MLSMRLNRNRHLKRDCPLCHKILWIDLNSQTPMIPKQLEYEPQNVPQSQHYLRQARHRITLMNQGVGASSIYRHYRIGHKKWGYAA